MSMRVTEAQSYEEKRNSIAYDYISFFEKLNYRIILIPNNTKQLAKYFEDRIDLVVLSGGNNVNPLFYQSSDVLVDVYNDRDNIEKYIVEIAIKKSIPVFAICRGFHFLNIYFGGRLSHNILNHVNVSHSLSSKLSFLNNKITNSYHNQAIKKDGLGKDLEILAVAENYVESFKHKTEIILAIQWHPERQNRDFDQELILKFLEGSL